MTEASDIRMTVRGFKASPAVGQQEQGNALTHPRLRGVKTGGSLNTYLSFSRPYKRCPHKERQRCLTLRRAGREPLRAVTARKHPSKEIEDSDESSIGSRSGHDQSLQNFFSLKAALRTHRRGAPAPLTTAAGGRSLPIRQARPQPHAGRQACGLPPASQHDAVCGGGGNPTVTASCCEGGLGGDRDA